MFPQISWLTIKISKKRRHGFVDEKALITNALNMLLLLGNPGHFLLVNEMTGNAFLTLIVNYHNIVLKNKLCHPKQQ